MKTFLAFSLALFFPCSLSWSACWKESDHLGKRKLFFKTIFDTPKKEVFFWLVDPSKLQRWLGSFSNHKKSKTPNNPFGVGHVRRYSAPFINVTLVDETITQYNTYSQIQYKATPSPFMNNHLGDMCLKTLSNGKTLFEWHISFDSNFLTAKFIQLYIRFSLWRLHESLR